MPQGVWVQVPPSARQPPTLHDRREHRAAHRSSGADRALIPWLDPATIISCRRPWALAVVCFIIFAETGLLVGFLLPGDTLLIIAGLLTHTNNVFGVNIWVVSLLIALSAFIGGEVGYLIGHKGGPAVFERKESGLFSKKNVERTNTG